MERVYGLGGTSVGAYQLWDCLGHSSCTAVYRASTGDTTCALKLVDGRLHENGDLAARLGREGAILDHLGHAGIVPIHDAIRVRDMTAVAMPFKRANSLRDLMSRGPLDTEVAWSILNQVAESLDLAHQRGLVYRVLKPSNILIEEDGRAFLVEFGVTGDGIGPLALVTPELHVAAPQYLAPEQVEGREPDSSADVYAFGVLAFELATGTPLHGTASSVDILQATLYHPGPSANARNPHLPPEVDAVFRRALAKDPAERHRSVWELIDELLDPPEVRVLHDPSPPAGPVAPVATFPALKELDVTGLDDLCEELQARYFSTCVRFGREVARDRWPLILRLADLQQYLHEDPPDEDGRVPEVLTLSRLVEAFDVVHSQDAPYALGRWGGLVNGHLLRSIQERPPWIAGPPTGRLVDMLSVYVEALNRVRGEELHAWKQVNRQLFRVVHGQNTTAVGRRRSAEACHFWKGGYEAALEWAGLAGAWLVAEIECGCVTGSYDCVFTLVRANR
jgi:serine/threonine-protein kinase